MMGINPDNYEQYFLDHLEGNLSREQEKELEAFLLAHPDLRPILEDLESAPILSSDPVIYHPKQKLKKTVHPTGHIDEHNAEEWMVSSVEGLLGPEQQNELREFLKLNPAFQSDMEMFRKTIVPADENVLYTGKNDLKKKAPVFTISRAGWIAATVAAMLLMFFGIRYLVQQEEIPAAPQVAQIEDLSGETAPTVSSPVSVDKETMALNHDPSAEISIHANPAAQEIPYEGPDQSFARVEPIRMQPGGPGTVETIEMPEIRVIADFNSSGNIEVVDPKGPSVISRVAGGILADAGQAFIENTRVKEIRRPRMNFWSFISSGIRGYNTITDRDIELLVKRDDEGKITSYALLEQDRLIMMRDLDKN